jgi:hypothetical protein
MPARPTTRRLQRLKRIPPSAPTTREVVKNFMTVWAAGLPAVPTEAFAGLDAWPRDARDEPALAQPGQVFGGEVRIVHAEFDGSAPPWSPAGPDGGVCRG